MITRGALAATAALCLAAGLAAPASAQQASDTTRCAYGICQVQLTPAQLLAQAEALIQQGRFSEATPLVEALEQAPEMRLQSRFLTGYAASQQGDFARASNVFKAILADDPGQTRVRLELARAMLNLGQTASADRQFKLAQASGDLPPEIAALIRNARSVIRSQRMWRFDVDLGIAPDSNINNATGANSVDVRFGDLSLPITLDEAAKARSGTGQTGSLAAGVRVPVGGRTALLVDLNGNGTNYSGTNYDDWLVQGAVGPQLNLSDDASIFVQGVAAQRWYAGQAASSQVGAKIGGQLGIGARTRVGVQFDARRTTAQFDNSYSGWQLGLYANAEHALSQRVIATGGLFARRDLLNVSSYSSLELGAALGMAAELPWGMNVGVNTSVSRAIFDAPLAFFSADARRDWRLGGSVTVGNRKLRMLGFSPSVSLSYNQNASSLAYYATDRLRLRFGMARYF